MEGCVCHRFTRELGGDPSTGSMWVEGLKNRLDVLALLGILELLQELRDFLSVESRIRRDLVRG